MEFTILNWNIGGAKYLEEKEEKRGDTRKVLNKELKRQIKRYNYPCVVTLQEIVRYGNKKETAVNLIDDIEGYTYYPHALIETGSMSANFKWNKVKSKGEWDADNYFAQGNAMLIRNDMPHFPVLDLSRSSFFSWDSVSEKDSYLLLKLLRNAFGNDLMNHVYLFNLNEIPENNNEVEKLIDFLIQNCNINWVTKNKIKDNIKKIDNGKTIMIYDEKHIDEKQIFDWDKISEDDDEKQKLIDFLSENFKINWITPTKIVTIDDTTIEIRNKKCCFDPDIVSGNNTTFDTDSEKITMFSDGKEIKLPIEEELIKLILDKENKTVKLTTSAGMTYKFSVKKENDPRNIYPNEIKFISLELNETNELILKRENGKVNTYEKLNFKKVKDEKILLYTTKKSVEITLDDKKEKVTLKIKDEDKKPLFSWDEISENDNVRLTEFLTQKFNIDGITTEKIKKSMAVIEVTTAEKIISLRLNDEKTKVHLEINDGRTDEFVVKTKNGKLNIYNELYNLKVKKENNKLNIYMPILKENPHIEKVPVNYGFYFGDRDTEPRVALVAHFIFDAQGEGRTPLDIFVVNLHLTTLTSEREGDPKIDHDASRKRQNQLDVIFLDMISTYNKWKRKEFPEREEKRKFAAEEAKDREAAVWILAGDFNFTPESAEYERIKRENFMDVVPIKGSGTKAKGVGKPPTLTLDYIFAGPKFISLDPRITEEGISNNSVDSFAKGSDHFPIYARIPLPLPEKK